MQWPEAFTVTAIIVAFIAGVVTMLWIVNKD